MTHSVRMAIMIAGITAASAFAQPTNWNVSADPANPTTTDAVTLTFSYEYEAGCVIYSLYSVEVQGYSIYAGYVEMMFIGCPPSHLEHIEKQSTVGPLAAGCYSVYVGRYGAPHATYTKLPGFCVTSATSSTGSGPVKFRGPVTVAEQCDVGGHCYGSYFVEVRIEEVLQDTQRLLAGQTALEVCFGNEAFGLQVGDQVEVYGYYYRNTGSCPKQLCGRVVAASDPYYIQLLLPGDNQTLPYEGSISQAGAAFRVNNTYTGSTQSYGGYFVAAGAEGRGVYGRCTSTAADVNNYGGFFYAAGPKGRGAFGQSAGGQEGIGVKGWASNAGNVQNYGGHFRADGYQGIGVYGLAHASSTNAANYGGWFQANGDRGIGVYAIGGRDGCAAEFEGDVKISGAGNGIVFPDGTRQTTAAGGGGGSAVCACSAPSYDSGWVSTSSGSPMQILSKQLTHNLGGNVDDYVVNLQMKQTTIAGPQPPTNRGIGSTFYYGGLTATGITVWGPGSAVDAGTQLRVRIWRCNCDSGSGDNHRY